MVSHEWPAPPRDTGLAVMLHGLGQERGPGAVKVDDVLRVLEDQLRLPKSPRVKAIPNPPPVQLQGHHSPYGGPPPLTALPDGAAAASLRDWLRREIADALFDAGVPPSPRSPGGAGAAGALEQTALPAAGEVGEGIGSLTPAPAPVFTDDELKIVELQGVVEKMARALAGISGHTYNWSCVEGLEPRDQLAIMFSSYVYLAPISTLHPAVTQQFNSIRAAIEQQQAGYLIEVTVPEGQSSLGFQSSHGDEQPSPSTIYAIQPNGWAASQSLIVGDRILSIGDQLLESLTFDDFARVISERPLRIVFIRPR
eukprot:TRINITY_DN58400_c0_g1_i1.p1 TRINITY_DN58400_c0_g1~~TRINITY_DN58400_c0_g1_i1.p1  ORF type:complete len:326 (-),score=62.26 TRINITY_DN58400_c0_g1_i1:82-1014(-)